MEQNKLKTLWKTHKPHLILGVGFGVLAVFCAAGFSWFLLNRRVFLNEIPAQVITSKNQGKISFTQPYAQLSSKLPVRTDEEEEAPLASLNGAMAPSWDAVINEIYTQPLPNATPTHAKLTPAYQRNAESLPKTPEGTPKIAIIIDDVGVNVPLSTAAEETLPPGVTFSYLPYGSATKELAQKARQRHREVMIHLPMEPFARPEEPPIDPGPNALYTTMGESEIKENIRKNLMFLKHIAVGVNNHMGSQFTSFQAGMEVALKEIEQEGLFFLDSLTTSKSVVKEAAMVATPHMPLLIRDVFLDHYQTQQALEEALTKLEAEAKEKGQAIAIGHPHKHTLDALQKWLPTLAEKGIALVPISHLLPKPHSATPTPMNVKAPY